MPSKEAVHMDITGVMASVQVTSIRELYLLASFDLHVVERFNLPWHNTHVSNLIGERDEKVQA